MKIRGGQAKFNGVAFFNADYAAKAVLIDGQIRVIQERVPKNPILAKLKRIPFLRGISLLFEINTKLVLVILGIDLIPWGGWFPSLFGPEIVPEWAVFALFGLILFVLRWRFPKIWQYHGAEHKVVNAQQKKKELAVELVRTESRIANDCGTNLIVFVFPFYVVLVYLLHVNDVLAFFIGLGVGYELFRLDEEKWKILTPFYVLGNLLQKHVVTIEPTDDQIEVAVRAYKALEPEKKISQETSIQE